jgi:polar amino acid transport system substrate-binding protein
MKVALGVVSPDSAPISSVEDLDGKTLIVAKGTTAETYFSKNYPNVKLAKYDQYAEAYAALQDGRGDALSTDNTEVLAWALSNPGFVVEKGVSEIGDTDTIAPAVQKGNTELLNWLDSTIKELPEDFFTKDFEETLRPVYGDEVDPAALVVENGVISNDSKGNE